jgi:hypothetical protein
MMMIERVSPSRVIRLDDTTVSVQERGLKAAAGRGKCEACARRCAQPKLRSYVGRADRRASQRCAPRGKTIPDSGYGICSKHSRCDWTAIEVFYSLLRDWANSLLASPAGSITTNFLRVAKDFRRRRVWRRDLILAQGEGLLRLASRWTSTFRRA